MNKILKPPHSFSTSAFTIFSDCCLRFTSEAHSFVFASSKLKSNILKNELLKSSHRSRLHHSGCTNLDKKTTDCLEIENGSALKAGRDSPFETNANRKPLDNEVIRKVLSLSSFDPAKVKKDKGLLDDEEIGQLQVLENFVYEHRFDHGCLVVKLMGREHREDTLEILTDSFEELMWGPMTYKPLLSFTIKQHMLERMTLLPHAATLVGLYAEREGEWTFGGTVEVSLNSKGAAEFPPTPVAPKNSPYLCNMAVNKSLR
ncbi:hypothetical protein KI387_008660, partial [Taxus chinensis]